MIKFREANYDDINNYFIWANDPLVRSISYNTNKITLIEHTKWFRSKIKDINCLMLLFTVSNSPIGQVRFEKENVNHYIINISVSNEFRGKGYGSEILKMATEHFFNLNPEVIINAYIKTSNLSSIKSFENASFKKSAILNYKGFKSFNYKLENENK